MRAALYLRRLPGRATAAVAKDSWKYQTQVICPFTSPRTEFVLGLNGMHTLRSKSSDAVINDVAPQRCGTQRRNEALEAVKHAGVAHLDQTAKDVSEKTRRPLLISEEEKSPAVRQLREARRIQLILEESLDVFSRKDSTFSIRGETIVVIEVEVSPDMRYARVYWSLPFSMVVLPEGVRKEVKKIMQNRLEERGGQLQALVHGRLRFYYPPKLRFVPADDDVSTHALKNLFGD